MHWQIENVTDSKDAQSFAERRTPDEGSVHFASITATAKSIDPSAGKERGPQDDSAAAQNSFDTGDIIEVGTAA
jgi:hypothetical protein